MKLQLFYIYNYNCPKCEQVKPLIDLLNDHPEIDIQKYPAENAKLLIEEFNLWNAPSIIIYKNGRPKGVIEKGFTHKGLKKQIFELTGFDIDARSVN